MAAVAETILKDAYNKTAQQIEAGHHPLPAEFLRSWAFTRSVYRECLHLGKEEAFDVYSVCYGAAEVYDGDHQVGIDNAFSAFIAAIGVSLESTDWYRVMAHHYECQAKRLDRAKTNEDDWTGSSYTYDEVMKLAQNINVLGLSQHACDRLYWNGCHTLGKLKGLTVQDILQIDGIGKTYCTEIVEKAASVGIIILDNDAENKHQGDASKTYPQNLLLDVFGQDYCKQSNFSFDSDHIAGISVALHYIDDRTAKIILLRYKHHATFDEIGNYFGISGSRAQQIINKAVKHLRHPAFHTLVTKGLDAHIQKKISIQLEDRVAARLKGEYLRGYYDGTNEANKDDSKSGTTPPQDFGSRIPLEDMDLSLRSVNCLKRAGIQ